MIGEILSAIPGVVSAGASVYDAIAGNGASQTTTNSPAPMTGDQARINNEFQNSVFGAFDPVYYLKNNPDIVDNWNRNHPNAPITADNIPDEAISYATKHWKKWGKAEGRQGNDPATTTTYAEKIAQDNAYQKEADQKYLADQGNTIDNFQNQLAGTTDQKIAAQDAQSQFQATNTDNLIAALTGANSTWNSDVQPIIAQNKQLGTSAPLMISIGGVPMAITSGSQRDAQTRYTGLVGDRLTNNSNLGSNIYNANTSLYDLIKNNAVSNAGFTEDMNAQNLGLDMGQNTLVNQINRLYTPNKDQNDYQNWLQALNQSNDSLRYGTPTQTTTGSISGAGNIAPTIQGTMDIVSQILKKYETPNAQQAGSNYTLGSGTSSFPLLNG